MHVKTVFDAEALDILMVVKHPPRATYFSGREFSQNWGTYASDDEFVEDNEREFDQFAYNEWLAREQEHDFEF